LDDLNICLSHAMQCRAGALYRAEFFPVNVVVCE
jgi:hypothetical protein